MSFKIAEKLMKGHGRILVRKSGTESKIRVEIKIGSKSYTITKLDSFDYLN